MIAPVLTEELRQQILEDYLSGLSLWNVGQKYPWLKKHQIRQAVEGFVRPKNTQRKSDPSVEELEKRRDEIRESWSPEVASRRWVGRYSRAEAAAPSLSNLFQDMGLDY